MSVSEPNLILLLLRHRWLALKNSRDKKKGLQALIFIFFSLLVLFFIWYGTSRLLIKLDSLNSSEEYSTILDVAKSFVLVGNLLKERLLSMVLMAIFFMLLFSSILNALSNLFLSQDTELLIKAPVHSRRLFEARLFETVFFSSWMSFFFFAPVLFAYTQNYGVSFTKILPFLLSLIPYVIIPCSMGTIFALGLAFWFPVHKSKKVFNFLMVFFASLILILLRMLQPEKLFSIQNVSEIDQFVRNLQIPLYDSIPPTWLAKVGISILSNQTQNGIEPALYLFGWALAALSLTLFLGYRIYLPAWSSSQEVSAPSVLPVESLGYSLKLNFVRPWIRAMIFKDGLLFARNPEVWSQTFLILAMVGLYLYNLHLLGLDQVSLHSHSISRFISFLNTAFVGFITTSISMRFLFPAISLEGPAFWILKTAPITLSSLIYFKFLFWAPWILILGWFMTSTANWILAVPLEFYALNLFNISVLCIGNSMLAISMGTIFPNYRAENINKIFMSYGGTFYMICSLGFMLLYLGTQAYAGRLYYLMMVRSQEPTVQQLIWACLLILLGLVIFLAFVFVPLRWANQTLLAEEDSFL
ncbi:MAG: hypothetical protein H3C47_01490 [Candidatus Cloacimonetes bacterium]|nr:hypothetical protein [Candidatus Cloacimonadota bacterium]